MSPDSRSSEVPSVEASSRRITGLLHRFRDGDRSALDETVGVLYGDLRHIAHVHRGRWRGDDTVGTTVLCHEAYLKLSGQKRVDCKEQAHFLSVASRTMRQILIDYSRAKRREKRGGGQANAVSFEEVEALLPALADEGSDHAEELLSLEAALRALEAESPRHARIVECKFFGGMTTRETAEALDLSPTSVKRGWSSARGWLHRFLQEDAGSV